MQHSKAGLIRYLFITVALVELYAEFTHQRSLMFFFKPFSLPLLAAYYFVSVKGEWNRIHKWMVLALIFSGLGTIFLMFAPETPIDTELMGLPKSRYFFLAGVGSFFVTQVLFIYSFLKSVSISNPGKPKLNKAIYLPFFVYWVVILLVIIPPLYANPEKQLATVPVMFYSAVLIGMGAAALSRYRKTNSQSFWFTFIGACLFIVSDSLISINFLALPAPNYYANFSIVITYLLAEYLIADGMLKHYSTDAE